MITLCLQAETTIRTWAAGTVHRHRGDGSVDIMAMASSAGLLAVVGLMRV